MALLAELQIEIMTPKFKSRSQAGQDRFVYEVLVKPEKLYTGTFVDCGSNHPVEKNNTFALEQLGWRGVLVDNDTHCHAISAVRKSPFVLGDATKLDWKDVLKDLPEVIDYLSLDIDINTLPALVEILKSGHRFRVITIEHDSYRFGLSPRDVMREMLAGAAGNRYSLICADVKDQGMKFEDWYVDPLLVSRPQYERFGSCSWDWKETLQKA